MPLNKENKSNQTMWTIIDIVLDEFFILFLMNEAEQWALSQQSYLMIRKVGSLAVLQCEESLG